MKVFKNKTILQILDYYKTLWAISYASSVVHWDLETYMPISGAGVRGDAMARLSSLRQKLFLNKDFTKLIHSAEKNKSLNDSEKGVVRVLLHSLKFYENLPPSFLEDFEKLTNKATMVWREAKINNEYKLFEPYLIKIFDMNKKMSDYLGYSGSPYDALLDQYEEKLSVQMVGPFFDEIRNPLKDLVGKITSSQVYKTYKPKSVLESLKYDKDKMVLVNEKILRTFWPGFGKNFRLDVSSHPFTTSFSNQDTRITTWYQPKSFGESLLATVHEFGHALYDLQCSDEYEMTPVQGGSSLVIHESQSRFWENFVGRGMPFIKSIIKDLRKVTGDSNLTVKNVYDYFNAVKPSLNRVEADEVTYHFHIMLRFEIERGIIEGKLKVKDIREIWNAKMNEYLYITPKTDRDGVLQDIHWSSGMVGYFPTYSLGTFLGAIWEEKLNRELNAMNYGVIREWLKEHIHTFGSVYSLDKLLVKNKTQFDPSINIKYLTDKYSKIYNLK